MKNERVDELIKLAWLEGWITTHGAYEKAVAKRDPAVRINAHAREKLIAHLEFALAETKAPLPLTVGGLLRDVRTTSLLKPQEIFSRIGVSQNLYRLMERDAISPLKISLDAWQRLMTLLNISVDDLQKMIRRTHQLVFFRPSFKGVLARYDARRNKAMKTSELEKAYAELFAQAELAVPPDEQEKLDAFLKTLQ
jgi:hypothetical protein